MATSFFFVGLVVLVIVTALVVVVVALAVKGSKGAAIGVSVAFGVVLLVMASVFAIYNLKRVEAREHVLTSHEAAQESYQEALMKVETLEGASEAELTLSTTSKSSIDAEASASLASEALAGGNYSLAEEHAAKATALRPQVAEYWTGLGMAVAAQGKKEAAIQHYEKALQLLKKEEKQRYLDQAMLLVYLGRADSARMMLEKHNADGSKPKLPLSMLLSDETRPFRTGVITQD